MQTQAAPIFYTHIAEFQIENHGVEPAITSTSGPSASVSSVLSGNSVLSLFLQSKKLSTQSSQRTQRKRSMKRKKFSSTYHLLPTTCHLTPTACLLPPTSNHLSCLSWIAQTL